MQEQSRLRARSSSSGPVPRPALAEVKNAPERAVVAARAELVARLRARVPEIEKAIFAQVRSLAEPLGDEDPAYVAGLRSAVTESLNYSLEGIEEGRASFVPIPPETVRQARRAAGQGVRLETVLRRYAAGNKALEEFIVVEADGIPGDVLCQILSEQGLRVDRLMESVAAAYREELERSRRSVAQRESERIVHLLESHCIAGPADLDHDFEGWHLGMIVTGPDVGLTVRWLVERSGHRSLHVVRDPETAWAWISDSRQPAVADLEALVEKKSGADVSVALGEPRKGLDGWRLTHREARAALQVMVHRPQRVTRCRDVILVSAVMRDQTLAMSLVETYLAPLDGRADAGEVLRSTLRAYFKADRNIVAAAAILGVARHTVERRLRKVERKLGQTLDVCNAQLQVALAVEEVVTSLGAPVPSPRAAHNGQGVHLQ